ncbi:hypothetical protein Tco_0923841 [Tanacetum coccineum]|uniref:Uncharacterized protein n=1 Tax=Tanacetum coccineum TaxID=301880 RepID=A0ABQ5D4X5_9ASTR
MPVRRIDFTEYVVCLEEQIRGLDCRIQYAVLGRRFDTSYPTGGYGVSDLATTLARDTHEMYIRFEDAQDDRALQRARVNMLFRDRAVHAELLAYRAEVRALHEHIIVLQRQQTEDQRARAC